MSEWSERLPGVALLVARLYVAQFFLPTATSKLSRGFLWGGALLLGALTRFSAGVGIFMVSNYLFSKGWSNPAATPDKHFIILLLVVLIGGAGEYWGLDGWWRRRRRR